MPTLIIVGLIFIASWLFEPLVYEGFEVKLAEVSPALSDVTSRTCIYLTGYMLVSHKIDGKYTYACPRRRGGFALASPGNLID